jgi:2-methylcitrate dehydratase PrpD
MEVFGRLATCTPVPNIHEYGFHPTALFGLVGATAGAAKALGLSEDLIAESVAVAFGAGIGLTGSFGTMVKPLHAGNAAASAVRGVQLALSGFRGNRRLFEVNEGLGDAYTRGDADWDAFKDALAGPFRLAEKRPSIKQYPCCGGNQRSIQNLAGILRDNALTSDDVERVELHVNPRQLLTVGRYPWPSDAYEAKFSLVFNVACTLGAGVPTLAHYNDAYWTTDEAQQARDRIEVIADGTGHKNQVTVTVLTRDGRSFSASEFDVYGSAKVPMSREDLSAKFFDASSYGELPRAALEALHDAALGLDEPTTDFWAAWEAVCTDRGGTNR